MMDYPLLVFAISLTALWLSAKAGAYLARRKGTVEEEDRADLVLILTATLTLLGLIMGFTFSMAISRYDLRKTDEAAEANAIGTEFARLGLLVPVDAARIRELMRKYVGQRVLFYTTRRPKNLREIEAETAQTQTDLWSEVEAHAPALPAALGAVVITGMNDVLNSLAYTQAAWWNRIPIAAWVLMEVIAVCCHALLGYTGHRPEAHPGRSFVLPVIVSTALFLIADIDSPRGGVVQVHPQNLESVAQSLARPPAPPLR
jgi:hypothetical protein